MKKIFAAIMLFAFACLSFAGTCPAGAGDCFLCGGDGIPCARSDDCSGGSVEGISEGVACACPQGKPCVCYCPYSQYGAVKEQLVASDDRCAGCLYGCSADKSVCISALASEIDEPYGPAEITSIEGELLVSADGGSTWALAKKGMQVDYGYIVRTGKDSRTTIFLDDGSRIYMDPETTLNMKLLQRKEKVSTMDVILELMKGAIFSDVTKREVTRFEVETSVSVTGVKGTQFSVSYDPDAGRSVTKVYDGNVSVTSQSGTKTLSGNQMVAVTGSGAGQVSEFDPSEDSTPFGGSACCGSGALIVTSLFIVGSGLRFRKK